VQNLDQQLNSPEMDNEGKTYLRELGAGALIGCGIGAVGEESLTVGAGYVVGGPPGGVLGGTAGTPGAVGACVVGGIEGVELANGVFLLSHLSLVGHTTSLVAQLVAAKVEAAAACH
jgi:hypothetical protein